MPTVTSIVMRLGAGLGAVVALLVGGAGAFGRALPGGGQLAYTTQEFAADARQLHLIDVGRNLRRDLVLYYAMDDLAWSPDGETLAFQADEPAQILIYQPFGEGAPRSLQAGDDFAIDTQPAWVGAGGSQRVAFLSLQQYQWSIKVADLTSGHIETQNVLPDQVNTPAWSPDGQWLAFTSRGGDELHQVVFIADLNGNVRQLTRSIGTDLLPKWSPDGTGKLAFFSDRDGGWNIYVIDASQPPEAGAGAAVGAETDSAQRVTNTPIGLLNFSWSADGQQIVFTGVNNFQHELYTQPAAVGSAARQLTNGMEADESAVWSPDNALIAYIFWADFPEIRVIDADGSRSRRFVDNDIVTSSLTWRPNSVR